jgi:hypothetical protein
MPTIDWFKELGKATRGNAKSLTIRENSIESMNAERWHALYVATPRVSHLDLRLADFGAVRGLFERGDVWSCLRSLTLHHTAQDGTHTLGTIHPLLRCNRTSLEDASFTLAYDSDFVYEVEEAAELWVNLTRLRSLRVHMRMDAYTLIYPDVSEMVSLSYNNPSQITARLTPLQRRFARCTPCLQQLDICGFGPNATREGWIDDATQHAEALTLWPHLQVLRTQDVTSCSSTRAFFVPLAQLRSFESQGRVATGTPWSMLAEYCSVVQENNRRVGTDRQQMQYPTLERYWVDDKPLVDSLKPCLAQSFASGTLSALGFQVGSGDLYGEGDTLIDDFLTDIAWMAGEPAVKTLGLFDLDLTSFHGDDWGRIQARITAVQEFVDSFPNLHTLVLSRMKAAEVKELALVAEGVMTSGRVSNLYVDGCTGTERDFLVQMAKEKGVVIGFDSKVLLPKFPMDLGATTGSV